MFEKLRSFYLECRRVLMVTKKPDREEFITTVKVSGLGMIIIGSIGFFLFLISKILV